jgi:FkbH-like protein
MNRKKLLKCIRSLLPEKPGVIVIHSSIPHLNLSIENILWDLGYIFKLLSQEGWTIVLPSFTFSFCSKGKFDIENSNSEVGILSDFCLKNINDFERSKHPIYSFVSIGKSSKTLKNTNIEKAFGEDTVFEIFEKCNATFIMLGCDWKYNTFFHHFEEIYKVPYRHDKVFSGVSIENKKVKNIKTTMFVRNSNINAINDFSQAVLELRKGGLIKKQSELKLQIEACQAKDIALTCKNILNKSLYSFVKNPKTIENKVNLYTESKLNQPIKYAILGYQNLDILRAKYSEMLNQYLPERSAKEYILPFGQLDREILEKNSKLNKFRPYLRIFCNRVEDIISEDHKFQDINLSLIKKYVANIKNLHISFGGWSIVHSFANLSIFDNDEESYFSNYLYEYNNVLKEELKDLSQIIWIDSSTEIAKHKANFFDSRLWYIGKFPYSNSFSSQLSKKWIGATIALLGKTTKLVVLDLDNTLWGGVLGEDGKERLKIGGDFPGNAYISFQKEIKKLNEKGIALAISSKNDVDQALDVLDNHSGMILKSSDFSVLKINYEEKWKNIIEIAKELNIGLDSICFIDDNPVERDKVKINLPSVKVIELNGDPANYIDSLKGCLFLSKLKITKEDKNRIQNYKNRKLLIDSQSNYLTMVDFYKSLEMTIYFSSFNDANADRTVQLINKTNQFNTTSRRYDLQQLNNFKKDGFNIIVIGYKDKYSTFENIGVMILKPLRDMSKVLMIDLYVLSCRFLGRGIENLIPRIISQYFIKKEILYIQAEIIKTERNTPARNIYADSGFKKNNQGIWEYRKKKKYIPPAWAKIKNSVNNYE